MNCSICNKPFHPEEPIYWKDKQVKYGPMHMGCRHATEVTFNVNSQEWKRSVACVNALAGMNPSAIKPLLDLLHRFVAYGREHERAVGLHDESNFLSTLEVALERLYDAGVTSSESNHPQAGSDA